MSSTTNALTVHTHSIHASRIHGNRRNLFASLLVVGWLLGPSAATVRGQAVDPLEGIGIPTFPTQLRVESGYINPANGNLHLEIPFGSFVERGGRQLNLAYTYDSGFWDQTPTPGYFTTWKPRGPLQSTQWTGGWHFSNSAVAAGGTYANAIDTGPYCQYGGLPKWTRYSGWFWVAQDGTTHSFPIQTTQGYKNQCWDFTAVNVPTGDGLALDASGYHMYVTNFTSAAVYAPDGTLMSGELPGNNPKDANGNYDVQSVPLADTLGRTVLTTTTNGNTTTFNVLDETGGTSTYTVTRGNVNVSTNFHSAGSTATEYSGVLSLIQSIQLPDGTSYSFTYDSGTTSGHYGQLISMKLPTGSTIYYTYANFADSMYAQTNHVTRGVSTRTTPDGTWTYTPAVITQCTSNANQMINCQQQLTVTKPAYNGQSDNTTYKYNINGGLWPFEVDYYNGAVSSANLLASLTQSFDYNQLCTNQYCARPFGGAINVTKLSATTTLLIPGGASMNKTTQYCYNSNYGNLLNEWEWNFYTGAVVHDPNPFPSCSLYSGSTPNRITTSTYLNGSTYLAKNIVNRLATVTVTDSGGATVAQTVNSYDDWALATSGATGIVHHDDTNYSASNTVRGNLTQTKRWLNTTGGFLTTSNHYDIVGNLIQTTDPNGNSTYFDYTDNYYGVSPSPPTAAYVTKTTRPVTNGVNHIDRIQYYFGTGSLSAKCGENFPVTSTCTYGLVAPQSDYDSYSYDSLNRPLTTNAGDGGQTSWNYGTSPSSSTGTTKINSSQNLVSTTILDGLGRKSQTQTSGGQGAIYADFTYDSNGRLRTASNPHFSTSSTTDGTTTYSSYDGLDRVLVVTDQDGSTVNTLYAGNCKTVTDEASKARKSCYDGFGRLTGVWEDPGSSPHLNYETDYQYDLLNNLLSVTQSGSRQRTFTYDSLSRLTISTNPESGTICYGTYSGSTCQQNGYDANGNLTARQDARNIGTTYGYDSLNRLTSKTYSDGTPAVTLTYDVATLDGLSFQNPAGRVVKTTSGDARKWQSYDPMGRVATLWQCMADFCATGNVRGDNFYNLAGGVTSYTGMGVTFTQTIDSANRVTQVTSNFVDPQHPATLATVDPSIGYYPNGAIRKTTFGNGLTETTVYNPRLQPCRIDVNSSATVLSQCSGTPPTGNVLDLSFNWNPGVADNGNLVGASAAGQRTFNRSYGYDSVNRLQSMSAPGDSCSGLSWTYDQWGNRTDQNVTSGTCGTSHLSINTQNRITNAGIQYDAAGNMVNDGSHSYTYDAENRITQVDGGTTATYVYDANGQRVRKLSGGVKIDYAYNSDGNVSGELWTPPGYFTVGYIYLNRQLVAEYKDSTTYFVHKDHLGSTRLLTRLDQTVCDSMDYLPFGEQIAGGTCTSHKFTGKERDTESGLDNFGARYNSSQYGRFMTPDEPLVGQFVSEPQSWNLYSYVQNNPINAVDPDGQDCVYVNDDRASYNSGNCIAGKNGTYVNGTIDPKSATYDSKSGTLSVGYTNSDTGAIGKAVIGNVNLSSGVSSRDLFGAVAQGTQMAAPGVNLAANGLQAFGWIAAPEVMALAQCGAAGGGCSIGGTALALIPGIGDLKALGIAAHEEKAIGGVLKQIADGTTKGKEFMNATGNLPAKAAGYYREFSVPLAGQQGRGAARIVTGAGGEVFYTADHYMTFTRLK